MKTKILCLLFAGCLLALVAWFVRAPTPVQADDVPKQYAETVSKGLEYLAKHQSDDGHWEGDDGQHPVAMTGLVGLALLMERNSPRINPFNHVETIELPPAKHVANVRKAADWLMSKSQPGRDGLIFSEHLSETTRYMQGHGVATLFLAGAFTIETDEVRRKKVADVLRRAATYIVKAQSSQGGWYQTSKVEGHDFDDVLATVIQLQALQAVENTGLFNHEPAAEDAQTYLMTALKKVDEGKSTDKAGRQAEIAGALACRIMSLSAGTGREREDETIRNWLKYCETNIPLGHALQFGRDELTHYYYAQVMYNLDAATWNRYRTVLFDHLQSSQNKDGSWPSGVGISVGRVYSTALWCTVLQLDHGSYPARRPQVFFSN